jgi:hypothetical protein
MSEPAFADSAVAGPLGLDGCMVRMVPPGCRLP